MDPLNPQFVTVLWHGWLKKLGGFSKRWKRRYFIFLSTASGLKELRHYDTRKDVATLLASTPKGVIAMSDATGICCFLPPSPSASSSRRHNVFVRRITASGSNLMDSHDTNTSDAQDQKFAILTPLQVHMLAFQSGREWSNASESQQGLSLLASLSAFYAAVEILHSGVMSKKRERTGHTATKHSMISYWKRHFFVFLNSGDLLYFKDETLGELQGRVDVRHAPTVRVTGERMLEERKKEAGSLLPKFAKLSSNDCESCLVWIATPPSKMFVIKLQEGNEGVTADGKRQELTASARKWLSLLLQGHAETKYTQLEQCVSMETFEATSEIVSAVRAGIPDELRGAMWKGFSGAVDLQRQAELKQTIRKVTKTFSIRSIGAKESATGAASSQTGKSFFDELSEPIETSFLHLPENRMSFARLCAVATHELQSNSSSSVVTAPSSSRREVGESAITLSSEASGSVEDGEDRWSESDEMPSPVTDTNSNKLTGKQHGAIHFFSSDSSTSSWELSARRRLLIATSRFNPFSHPCPWKVLCLLLAYLDEESVFWVTNSIQDVYLPGYFHGYRPALQVDVTLFIFILEERSSALFAHLAALAFPVGRTAERWFLSLFTSTMLPLSTVLRIWDAFFVQGVRILFGVGMALFRRAEDKLFQAKSTQEVHVILNTIEQTSVDADALFSHALKDDLNISWISEQRFYRIRGRSRQRVIEQVTQQLSMFKENLGILNVLQDQLSRALPTVKDLLSYTKLERQYSRPASLYPGEDGWLSGGVAHDSGEDDNTSTLQISLMSLHTSVKDLTSTISALASDLNSRQARWLALSSQLAGYPLSHKGVRMSSDLQSWLLQVKEGKVSGAGLDALHGDNRSKTVGIDDFSQAEDHHGLFVDISDEDGWSCLFSHKRSVFQTHEHFITENFLYAMVTVLKALCAARLGCLQAANRSDWHSGRWLQSLIDYSENASSTNGRVRSSSRGLHRSMSNANKPMFTSSSGVSKKVNLLSLGESNDHPTTRNSLDDSVLRRRYVNETPQRQSIAFGGTSPNDRGFDPNASFLTQGPSIYMDYDATYYAGHSSPTSPSTPTSAAHAIDMHTSWNLGEEIGIEVDSDRAHQQLSSRFRFGEQALHSAIDSLMSCFSRFIRVENCNESNIKSELRDRALLLEEDLIQDLREMEAITRSSKQLF